MKFSFSRFFTLYFNSWWLSPLMALSASFLFAIQIFLLMKGVINDQLATAIYGVYALTFIVLLMGIVGASIQSFINRKWARGIALVLALCICTCSPIFLFALSVSPWFQSDDFGKDIIIPPGMKVESPEDSHFDFSSNSLEKDIEGKALVEAFTRRSPDASSTEVSVDLPVLNEFAGPNGKILFRHLASSAKWFVTRDRGIIIAFRRCVVNGKWKTSLNGFYSSSDLYSPYARNAMLNGPFQFRIAIRPGGTTDNVPLKDISTVANTSEKVSTIKTVDDKENGQGIESYLVLESAGAALEIFEQSRMDVRPLTALALQQINNEFLSVLSSPITQQRGFDPSLMPTDSIREGASGIYIGKGIQGGIYDVYAYVNPGEPGYAYLKVFEATRNTPLSADRMSERSTEFIGWSDNPEEQFLYNSNVIVYEGDWGVFYPARFELWFVPDSGKPERKLIEKIFKIEGWQR